MNPLQGCTQFHCAETEKYAHVTFFFNGGKEAQYEGEERKMVPSPKVGSYLSLMLHSFFITLFPPTLAPHLCNCR